MRVILIVVNSFLFFGCIQKPSSKKLIPLEYDITSSNIGLGLKMIYVNRNINDTTSVRIKSIPGVKGFMISQTTYSGSIMSDSVIIQNRNITEYYINMNDDGELWKANQISETLLTNENGLQTEEGHYSWRKDTFYAEVTTKMEILKDTILQWNNKEYNGLKTKTLLTTSSNFLKSPDGKYISQIEVVQYFAKGIGIVKRILICPWFVSPINIDLIEIQNLN